MSTDAMAGMPMPGGWTMSMAWMRMPGQSWAGAAGSFLGMWTVMMVAMMLPSLVPVLRRHPRPALVGLGYFFVWTAPAIVVFPLGAALATLEMQQPALSRAVPLATGVVVFLAGALQLTAWKARHLACCREPLQPPGDAFRYGLRLGLHCVRCCASLVAILLVVGVMDVRAMAVVTGAITAERLAPAGHVVARAIGAVTVVAGLFLIARAAGPG